MGGGGEVQKNSSAGKLSEKDSCTATSPEKKFLHEEKKCSCKGNVNEK